MLCVAQLNTASTRSPNLSQKRSSVCMSVLSCRIDIKTSSKEREPAEMQIPTYFLPVPSLPCPSASFSHACARLNVYNTHNDKLTKIGARACRELDLRSPYLSVPWTDDLELCPAHSSPQGELPFTVPAGGMAVFWPYAYGLVSAARPGLLPYHDFLWKFTKCGIGAFLMRSAACTINDILDREFDASVARTRNRPIASGRISVFSAVVFLLFQLALNVLFFFTFERPAFWAAMVQLFPLSCLYPLLKRVTYWPQAWLGVAINFGFLVSWLDCKQGIPPENLSALVMLVGLWCWTMSYDTIYGSQDRDDDSKIGIWSTALLFVGKIKTVVTSFSICFVWMLYLFGGINDQGFAYFAISVGGAAVFLTWLIVELDENSPESCWTYFTRNNYYLGVIIFCGAFVDYILAMETIRK
ncbi:UbiA prenyltransferase [Sanghuangporus baumii]|uniref:UbiA prenyltransferase n=1 Tax=Sanghuangporus baumii TaxID=108892 RepID=A0A9Q5HSJ2_SANBA|nr:UbiA prenyltransferase [Sanghuangporus baumii]